MGEPLANYAAVVSAVRAMTDSALFSLARRHVTVSTVGIAPRIRDMARDLPVRVEWCMCVVCMMGERWGPCLLAAALGAVGAAII
jgi:NAD(P)-dependent dehydrogenase (short-subunit alcohol dehydrogenase family)